MYRTFYLSQHLIYAQENKIRISGRCNVMEDSTKYFIVHSVPRGIWPNSYLWFKITKGFNYINISEMNMNLNEYEVITSSCN